MEYTKGERQLYCADDCWLVEIKDKPNRPMKLIGKFKTKEDAILDSASPDMYEALKELIREYREITCIYTSDALEEADKALQKAEGK